MLRSPLSEALFRIAATGVLAGAVGAFFGSVRANLFGGALIGAIGAVSAAVVLGILRVDPIFDAGEGFSYLWGGIGGFLLGYVVSRSTR